MFVAPQRLFDFNSDSQGSWERDAFFLGRELRTDGNNQVLMKSWINVISIMAQLVPETRMMSFLRWLATQSYFGVIDVLDMCLKSLPLRPGKVAKPKSSGPSHSDSSTAGSLETFVDEIPRVI